MKIQNLAIIFLVIAIPLIIILSYYLQLQQETLTLQSQYDAKLSAATKDAIQAFEVNTVDWKEWVSKKTGQESREEINSVVNTFITSLANDLKISGAAKEYIQNYIPAIVITMYDGYYIYTPTYTPKTKETEEGIQLYVSDNTQNKATTDPTVTGEILYEAKQNGKTYQYTDENGNTHTCENATTEINEAKMEYKNIVNNKIIYSANYKKDKDSKTQVTVDYTLDNRIYVYGIVQGESTSKNGYLVYYDLDKTIMPKIFIRNSTNNASDQNIFGAGKITETYFNGTKIEPEELTEQLLYIDEITGNRVVKTFPYVYDITYERLYYDKEKDDFFTLDNNRIRNFIGNEEIKVGDKECKYKSVTVLCGEYELSNSKDTEYKKIYCALNGKDKGKWYIDIKENSSGGEKELDTEIKEEKLKEIGLERNRNMERL